MAFSDSVRSAFGLEATGSVGPGGTNLAGPPPVFKSADLSFRRPDPPAPIERYEILHPSVPPQAQGLTILHISDLHVKARRTPPAGLRKLAQVVGGVEVDLVVLTGDYTDKPGDGDLALRWLERLGGLWRSRLGAFGIFGNHDSPAFAARARGAAGIRWLDGECVSVAPGVSVLGCSSPEDLLAARARMAPTTPTPPTTDFVITLVHYPTEIYAAARLGLPLVLAGHIHGGQVRPSVKRTLHTSCDLPGWAGAGVLRLGGTLVCVSRGIGYTVAPIRINCPPQAPLYELRRGEMAGSGERLEMLRPW